MTPFPGHAKCWIAELQRMRVGGPLYAGECSGVLIRAHLIPKQRIRREFPRGAWRRANREEGRFEWLSIEAIGEVPHRSLDEIVWDPRVWVPMCGGPMGNAGHHGMLDAAGVNRIKLVRAWIPAEVEAFAVEYGLEWSLEADYGPKETTT